MKTVCNSFTALGKLWNSTHDRSNRVKMPKEKKAEVRKCKNCGGPLRSVAGTNIWVCDFFALKDEKLPDGKEVQVFEKCGNQVISE